MSYADQILQAGEQLNEAVGRLSFREDRRWIYNPLSYAWKPYRQYVQRFLNAPKQVLFLGMNPGPWGMVQTGIPFGEIAAVRGWLGIDAPVGRPAAEHPKRPVEGWNCRRSEVSGRRLWGLMQTRFSSPEHFFTDHAVFNYCPLVFMEESGKNLTPDKLTAEEKQPLHAACDTHLAAVISILTPKYLVGVGKYAEKKLAAVARLLAEGTLSHGDGFPGTPVVTSVLHPSPASPAANRGWEEAALRQLTESGVWSGHSPDS